MGVEPRTTGPVWRGLAVAAGLVALADAAQPLVFDWKPKLYGALAGAALYAAIAIGAWGRRRWAAGLALAVPALPVGVLAATAAGVDLPVTPDAAMVGILVVQLVAAGLAAVALRSGPPA
jgi:hypothetical protein